MVSPKNKWFVIIGVFVTLLNISLFLHYRFLRNDLVEKEKSVQEFLVKRDALVAQVNGMEKMIGSMGQFANILAGRIGIEPPELKKGIGPVRGLNFDEKRFEKDVKQIEVKSKDLELRLRELKKRQDDKLLFMASKPSIWPVKGWVTSEFGNRRSPFRGRRVFHRGLDIGSQWGNKVVAPAAGRVVYAGYRGALGRVVIIEHGYGIRSTFAHASKLLVRSGQIVERGKAIAKVGSSGHSTGPHLHYEIHVDGVAVDPMQYILQ